MNALLYALYVIILPLWVFWGLYIVLEFREHFRAHRIKHEDDT